MSDAAVRALETVAFELERRSQPTNKVTAFRRAAATAAEQGDAALRELDRTGTLERLPGIGRSTAGVIRDALAGRAPAYLERLVAEHEVPEAGHGAALLAAIRGDCHTHTDWSDGGAPLLTMARTARDLGHEWIACTDHTKAAYYAGGLDLERLVAQVQLVAEVNEELAADAAGGAPAFRVLTGCEVDILDGGALDHPDEVLELLEVVVASVHSRLGEDEAAMTKRLVRAVENPHVDVLGHCTGRLVLGRRPRRPSDFDAEAVFGAASDAGTAIEINCRPERLDPPRRLLQRAVELGCTFAIDTDAHAPGQLAWLVHGVDRAAECGVAEGSVINTRSADRLVG